MKSLLVGLFAVFLLAGCLGGGAAPTPTPYVMEEATPTPEVMEATPTPEVMEEGPTPVPTPAFVAADKVTIIYGSFNPNRIKVSAGTQVTFENQDSALHSVKALDGSFNSGNIAARQVWKHVFDTPGTFEYKDNTGAAGTGFVMVE